jgi:molybdate transport system permease protein
VLEMPMVLSPVSLGALILIFFNTRPGEFIQNNIMSFVFEVSGIILAQFITTAGIATRLIKTSLDEIPLRYEAVARSLGATPFNAFLTVTMPLARKGILAAAILSWAKAIGEFGATIMVAGSMSMKTETIPVAIFMRLASADIGGTIVLILILLILGIGVLYLVRLLGIRTSET